MRRVLGPSERRELCTRLERPRDRIVITGITKSYLDFSTAMSPTGDNLTMVIDGGKIICLDTFQGCNFLISGNGVHTIHVDDGHVLPGLTAFSVGLGVTEISFDDSTGDGNPSTGVDALDPESIVYAKYGIHLEGRAFERARIGGVTRAITAPYPLFGSEGFLGGISVGIKTSGKKTILNGGIFQDDVALHFVIGQASKGK
jgi:imidazolonepropionase-like amidohydrolase